MIGCGVGAPGDRYGVQAMFFVVRPDRAELSDLARLVDGGRLQSVVSQTFPLAEGRQAFRPGKTVLVVR